MLFGPSDAPPPPMERVDCKGWGIARGGGLQGVGDCKGGGVTKGGGVRCKKTNTDHSPKPLAHCSRGHVAQPPGT